MTRRLILALGLVTVYRGRRAYVRRLRERVLVLGAQEARALERIVNTNLSILTVPNEDFVIAQLFVRRVREMR